jgi:hypothetical protein
MRDEPHYTPATYQQRFLQDGLDGARWISALYEADRHHAGPMTAVKIFASRWPRSTALDTLRQFAAVAPGTTTDPAWAQPLVQMRPLTALVALARADSVLDRANFRQVPLNVSIAATTAGASFHWTAQGAPKPVSKMAFTGLQLGLLKSTGIIVLSEELLKLAAPGTETFLRDELVSGLRAWLDAQLLDPTAVAVPGELPGSITSTATSTPATSDPKADVLALLAAFSVANPTLERAVVIANPVNVLAMRSALGPAADGDLGVRFLSSAAAGTNVVVADAGGVVWGDLGGISIDASRQATLQLDDAPLDPPTAAAELTNLWQANLVGLKVERFINWKPVTPTVVAYLSGATYGAPTP